MTYKLSPTDGAPIEKVKADKWIKKYKDKHPHKDEIIARFFGKDIVQKILDQKDCVGISESYPSFVTFETIKFQS